jgi:hypothetical protein
MYGIDSISVWPRLIKIISDKSDEQITAAKTFVDFYVNLTYLSFLLLPLLIARMIYNVHANNSYGFIQSVLTIWWQPVALLGIVGGIWVFYKASVIAAISWGSQVKSTFDLYIDDLARNLGYCSPLSQDVWVEISQSFAHNDPLPPKSLHYPAVSPDTSKHPPP